MAPNPDESIFVSSLPVFPKYIRLQMDNNSLSQDPTQHKHNFYPFAWNVQRLRKFVTEAGKEGVDLFREFQESSLNQTASQRFRHFQPGENVAITSRYIKQHDYIRALGHRGVQVRIISVQTGNIQDFCFLKRAQWLVAAPFWKMPSASNLM